MQLIGLVNFSAREAGRGVIKKTASGPPELLVQKQKRRRFVNENDVSDCLLCDKFLLIVPNKRTAQRK